MSTQPMMFPSEWSERMAYERAKAGYWPYDIEDLRHFCALRDLRIEELKAENAKLWELVRQMHTCLTRPKVYAGASHPYLIATECPYFTQGVCDYNSCGFERRMRELGVEQ